MPNKVRLHNRDDGTIVGIDENGNEVPVEFADGGFQTLHAGSAEIADGSYLTARDDAELDDVLEEASDGTVIYLGNGASFDTPRTINQQVMFVGGSIAHWNSGAAIDATWTLDDRVGIVSVGMGGDGEVVVNAQRCGYFMATLPTVVSIEVNDDGFRFVGNRGADVTFSSDTSAGIVDGCAETSVTDNGDNTVGDIG